MTVFDSGRNIAIFESKGVLRGGAYTRQVSGHDIAVRLHESDEVSYVDMKKHREQMEGSLDA